MLRSAFLALCLAAPSLAAARERVDPATASVVERMQGLTGEERGGVMRITRVRGEGRTIILEVDIMPGAHRLIGPAQVAGGVTSSLCAEPGAADILFGGGRTLRFQVTREGRAAGMATVDRCPPHSGEGITAASFAAGMQSIVGVPQGGGVTITAVRGEGNMVIMTVRFPAAPASSAPGLADSFLSGFCRRPEIQDQFFGIGMTLRIDIVLGRGASVRGRPVTRCPGR